jgi:hypothetical protein
MSYQGNTAAGYFGQIRYLGHRTFQNIAPRPQVSTQVPAAADIAKIIEKTS